MSLPDSEYNRVDKSVCYRDKEIFTGDLLKYSMDKRFQTYDNNDGEYASYQNRRHYYATTPVKYHSAWWHDTSYSWSNLNGNYLGPGNEGNIT